MNSDIQIEQIPYYLTWRIRQEVMYPGKPIETVKLPDDPQGLHFGLYLEGKLTSILSLFEHGDHVQLRKFATLTEQQRKGYGKQLLQYAIDFTTNTDACILWCNARVNALPFYEAFGFKASGPTWEAVSYTFVKMDKLL